MERHEYNSMSPAGRVEQWGALAGGLKYNRQGRRRAARMLVGLLLAIMLLIGIAFIYAWLS